MRHLNVPLLLLALLVHSQSNQAHTQLIKKQITVITLATFAALASISVPTAAYLAHNRIHTDKATVKKRVVVIDFDQCLMKDHIFGKYRHTPVDNIPLSLADFGLKDPKVAFDKLKQQRNLTLAIASFGRKAVIQKALNLVTAKPITIKTPADVGVAEGRALPNKNALLALIAKEQGVGFSQIMLFDDTTQNLEAAKQLGVTVQVAKPFDEASLATAIGFAVKSV